MKRTILAATAALGLSVLLAPSVFAQGTPGTPGAGRRQQGGAARQGRQRTVSARVMVEALGKLTLTPDQKSKIDPLSAKITDDLKAVRKDNKGNNQEIQAKTRELTTKFRADVEAILTPEQKTALQDEIAKANPAGGQIGAAMVTRTIERLNLTPEQKTKVDPIVADATKQLAAAQGDTTLKGRDKMQKMMGIYTDMVAKIKPLVTPEQAAMLDRPAAGGGNRRPGGRGGAPTGGGAAGGVNL